MVVTAVKPTEINGAILEAWAEGEMLGSLVVMACITFANMRQGVLLHKLILVELIFGMFHGTFIFANPPVYHWYLSCTAILLNTSWTLHNVIAWLKVKPFLPRWGSLLYISTVILVQPYWVLEVVANFLYFGGWSNIFIYTRPYEALFRDPWWIFTAINLFYNIKSRYSFGLIELVRVSPRFGVLLGAMLLSICFLIVDILAVTHVISGSGLPDGINPFWKLSFVFKCLTDTMVLDDFKTALDRLKDYKLERMGSVLSDGLRGDFVDVEQARRKKVEGSNGSGFPSMDPMALQPYQTHVRDWTKPASGCEHLDLEAALREVEPEGESSKSNSSGG